MIAEGKSLAEQIQIGLHCKWNAPLLMQHTCLITIVKTLKIIQLYSAQSQNNTQHLFNENTSKTILQEKLTENC